MAPQVRPTRAARAARPLVQNQQPAPRPAPSLAKLAQRPFSCAMGLRNSLCSCCGLLLCMRSGAKGARRGTVTLAGAAAGATALKGCTLQAMLLRLFAEHCRCPGSCFLKVSGCAMWLSGQWIRTGAQGSRGLGVRRNVSTLPKPLTVAHCVFGRDLWCKGGQSSGHLGQSPTSLAHPFSGQTTSATR